MPRSACDEAATRRQVGRTAAQDLGRAARDRAQPRVGLAGDDPGHSAPRARRQVVADRDALGCPVFFFNDTATTEIYTLSLHDALPICLADVDAGRVAGDAGRAVVAAIVGR